MKRECKICGFKIPNKEFISNRKYCNLCRYKDCPICEKSFLIKPNAKKQAIYCSKECMYSSETCKNNGLKVSKIGSKYRTEHKTGVLLKCSWCEKEIYKMPSQNKHKNNFCNVKCFTKWSRSAQNKQWKGDDYPENKRLRNSGKYKKWRKMVWKRDNFTCQNCGIRNGKITADHIKSWALYPELRFKLSNGKTLCRKCHYKTETWGLKSVYQQLKSALN